MAKSVTLYDLLISCPSDVKEELKIINETVNDFNRMYGHVNNASINTKHWSKDSYPQSGGRPQVLLNQQFVLDCDAAVAVFWTRFGTPTDEYGSGTEEEIEELIKSGKQVFLYFSEKAIKPSDIDLEQYKKIQEFKEKYGQNNIYYTYTTLEDFKGQFLNHLSLYFLKQFVRGGEKPAKIRSNLSIKGVDNGRISERPYIIETDYSNSIDMLSIKDAMTDKISRIKQIGKLDFTSDQNEPAYPLPSASLFTIERITINDSVKEVINNFCRKENITIDEIDFYNVGHLGKQKNLYGGITIGTSSSPSYHLVGKDEEKEKYTLLKGLNSQIKLYNEWLNYYNELDKKCLLNLCLSNTGTQYDEDIDVKLFFKEGLLCKKGELPIPGPSILKHYDDLYYVYGIFKPEKSVSIQEYKDYPNTPYTPRFDWTDYEDQKEEYLEVLEELFIYDFYNEDGFDIISYKQKYLKHNNNVYLPSLLYFNSAPNVLRYEISSKYSEIIFEGELEIEHK
ncbi:hypothetical protein P8917_09675 [Bacillus atrophaeus]|uniref:hypothetical protein n=2 Tax=Bacillus atrophaeus TaxID=1452 RepID=UPI00227DB5D6|nr:hypothetical protein [Bacillus atrophaeus]MCY8814529.1 hypothetical protein [Bacillus atrophaeus]MCY8823249.1 hypothetical protein [Bacillus atrophaeus]MCY8831389.1 hypothetical protein [Bacillus atrophaeus]MCY8834986.1 hypothetical protein [Bacillus atrophaeus]MEC0748246.1 hypothetical protein [Bacillus atrophaeus]